MNPITSWDENYCGLQNFEGQRVSICYSSNIFINMSIDLQHVHSIVGIGLIHILHYFQYMQ